MQWFFNFFQQAGHEPVFRHGAQDLAMRKDNALPLAAGNAEIGFPGFTRTIDSASHDSNGQRIAETGESFSTSKASFSKGTQVLPQVGQETRVGP